MVMLKWENCELVVVAVAVTHFWGEIPDLRCLAIKIEIHTLKKCLPYMNFHQISVKNRIIISIQNILQLNLVSAFSSFYNHDFKLQLL